MDLQEVLVAGEKPKSLLNNILSLVTLMRVWFFGTSGFS